MNPQHNRRKSDEEGYSFQCANHKMLQAVTFSSFGFVITAGVIVVGIALYLHSIQADEIKDNKAKIEKLDESLNAKYTEIIKLLATYKEILNRLEDKIDQVKKDKYKEDLTVKIKESKDKEL